jgi:hypothetical protein
MTAIMMIGRTLQITTRRCPVTAAVGRFRSFSGNTVGSQSSPDLDPNPAPSVSDAADAGAIPPSPFPWRSSPILLDRLAFPNNLSGTPPFRSPLHSWIRHGFAAAKLQYGWPAILLGTWKRDLADDLGWAFQKGLAGLLSHVLSSEYA